MIDSLSACIRETYLDAVGAARHARASRRYYRHLLRRAASAGRGYVWVAREDSLRARDYFGAVLRDWREIRNFRNIA